MKNLGIFLGGIATGLILAQAWKFYQIHLDRTKMNGKQGVIENGSPAIQPQAKK
jgi:hypothetical protein